MRLTKHITLLTLVFWLIQSLAYISLFASFFTDLIVRLFIALGFPIPENRITTLASGAMVILSWPVRVLFASAWNQASSWVIILLLLLNSFVWGIAFGTGYHIATQKRGRATVSHS